MAIYLMGTRKGGTKKVHWTSGGHFVSSVGYQYKNGKHYVYVKDSYSNSSLRNGWITYEENMKGDVLRVWSGKLNNKLTIDGDGGANTIKAMQRFLGTEQDGVITGQNAANAKYRPSVRSVNNGEGGSACVKALQRWLGLKQDGDWGKDTSMALQKKLGVEADGVFGKGSMKAWQKYLNEHDKAVYPVVEKTKPEKAVEYAKKIAADNSYHYVVWKSNDAKTKQCPICHGFGNGKYKGFNCIRFVFACWRHGGGIPCKCEGGLINNAIGQKMYTASDAEMLKLAQNAIGCKDIKVFRNKNGFGDSKLQIGDACMHFEKGVYKHIYLYAGNGQMVDSGNWKNTADQIKVRKRQSCQIVVRYTGK